MSTIRVGCYIDGALPRTRWQRIERLVEIVAYEGTRAYKDRAEDLEYMAVEADRAEDVDAMDDIEAELLDMLSRIVASAGLELVLDDGDVIVAAGKYTSNWYRPERQETPKWTA